MYEYQSLTKTNLCFTTLDPGCWDNWWARIVEHSIRGDACV